MSWTVQYEANELPENATPAWIEFHDPDPLVESTVEINPAGFLHVVGDKDEWVSWGADSISLDDAVGVTVEMKVKVISGEPLTGDYGVMIQLQTGHSNFNLQILTDGIKILDNGTVWSEPYLMDTTDDYHIYRVTVKDRHTNVYVDGILRLQIDNIDNTASSLLQFGLDPQNGVATWESLLDYLYYRTDGAFAPEIEIVGFKI